MTDNLRSSLGVLLFTPIADERGASLKPQYDLVLGALRERIASIPWVPNGWSNDVAMAMANNQGMEARLASPFDATGQPRTDNPAWLNSDERRNAWDAIRKAESEVIKPIISGQISAAKQMGDALTADAAFWDGVYNGVKAVRDLPATAVNAVADGIGSAVFGNVGKLLSNPMTLLLLAAVAGVLYYRYVRKPGV